MLVKRGNTFSEPFHDTNSVRQGEVLSPNLYALHLDDLSKKLNLVRAGCCIGSKCLNHLMFADDICVFAPTIRGLQRLYVVHMSWKMRLFLTIRKHLTWYLNAKTSFYSSHPYVSTTTVLALSIVSSTLV